MNKCSACNKPKIEVYIGLFEYDCECSQCPRCSKRFLEDDDKGPIFASSDEDSTLYGEPYCERCWGLVKLHKEFRKSRLTSNPI